MKNLLTECLIELSRTQDLLTQIRVPGGAHDPFIAEQSVRNTKIKARVRNVLHQKKPPSP